jgi:hypothetical protein
MGIGGRSHQGDGGMRNVFMLLIVGMIGLACSSTATHGILSRQVVDVGSIIEESHTYEEIGPVEGRRCRFFLLNIIPWGDSTTGAAMEKALSNTGGNAVVNAAVTTSLYGFVPIYNVLSFSCTTVRGVAVRID